MQEGIYLFENAEDFLQFIEDLQEHYNNKNKGSVEDGAVY